MAQHIILVITYVYQILIESYYYYQFYIFMYLHFLHVTFVVIDYCHILYLPFYIHIVQRIENRTLIVMRYISLNYY